MTWPLALCDQADFPVPGSLDDLRGQLFLESDGLSRRPSPAVGQGRNFHVVLCKCAAQIVKNCAICGKNANNASRPRAHLTFFGARTFLSALALTRTKGGQECPRSRSRRFWVSEKSEMR